MKDPRCPIGRFEEPATFDWALRATFLTQIEETPASLRLALHAWHGRHHVAHIASLGERMGGS